MRTYAYAWLIKADADPYGAWVLCRWAVPSIDGLDVPPTPEAKRVRVELVPSRKSVRKRLNPANPGKKCVRQYREYQALRALEESK